MRFALPAILFFALTLTACEGPTGPEGPQGPPGAEGPQGPPGSTNVETTTVTVRAGNFQDSGSVETAAYQMDIITQAVVDGGAVLAYTNLVSGGQNWTALPFTIPLSSAVVSLTYSYGPGALALQLLRPDGNGPVAGAFDDTRLKVVAIPPAQTNGLRLEVLQQMSYEEVAARFELE